MEPYGIPKHQHCTVRFLPSILFHRGAKQEDFERLNCLVSSLCSKRSRMKRAKCRRRISFSHSERTKNGARAKRLKEGGGGGERRERLPANPSILKNPFAQERGSWLVRHGHLDWQVYQVRLNDSSNNSCVTRICHKRKLFSCCFSFRSYAKIQQDPADFDSLIWQPRLALLSHFSCSDNERPNLRSRRLVVVFRAKPNLLALTIFKQRIPISG